VRRVRLLTAILLGVSALVLALAVPAAAAGANYVALGDSYASGVGAGDYLDSSGDCDRSPHAYSALWANANAPASYTSVACSGATTDSVVGNQLAALSGSTSLVSITVGGNDVGFSSIMQDCILYGTDTCVSEVDGAEADARANLPGKLDNVYSDISSAAPSAHVVVLDYPHFYDLAASCSVGLSDESHTKIDEGIDVLDGLVQDAAARHGFTFADVRGAFGGHELCDSDPWLHSTNFLDLSISYHPTAAGHANAYYPVFSSAAG
jgi:lysophospholipase L1-like esterase